MATQFMDSEVYGGAWGTPELRAIFEEEARVTRWLEILAVLAETEGEFGLIPADMAARVAAAAAPSSRMRIFSMRSARASKRAVIRPRA